MLKAAIRLKNDYLKYLLGRKFSSIVFSAETTEGNFMVYLNGASRNLTESTHRRMEINNYKSELDSLNIEQLSERHSLEKESEKQEYVELDKYHFFNQNDAQADFSHWVKLPEWTLDESVALSFSKSPTIVNRQRLSAIDQSSPFVKDYKFKYDQLNRLIPNTIEFPCKVERILEVFTSIGMSFPQELLKQMDAQNESFDQIEQLRRENKSLKLENEQLRDKKLHPKAEESMLKIIAGLLTGCYGRPSTNIKVKSTLAKEVTQDILNSGLTLDEDTVRKYIRKSLAFMPKDYTNQDI